EATKLIAWLDMILKRLEGSPFDEATVKRMRELLTAFKDNEYPDYESARQRAWAFVILSEELDWKPGMKAEEQLHNYRRRLDACSGQLDLSLMLVLPSGPDKEILVERADGLKKQSNYDPRAFVQS